MYRLYDENVKTDIYYDCNENICITKAIMDLQKDIGVVGGKDICVNQYLPDKIENNFIIGTLKNKVFANFVKELKIDISHIENKWEKYLIRTIGDNEDTLIIIGSDDRGTMWGIYEFSERFLGVDPLYLWTDYEPVKMDVLEIEKINIADGPCTFKYRGWFVNDEDLISGYCKGAIPEKGYHYHKDYVKTLEMIVETGLRLKQNLLIPCTYLDIENPFEEALVRIITERGMYISMHHQEPVGVHQFTVDRYWKERGIEDINYFEHKDKYEFLWRKYIKKWSKYDNVIWQLGLRGRGDRPVWYNSSGIPTSTAERGKLISDAIKKQLEIIKEENPDREIISTSTLWMEGMGLFKENALTFPEETIVVQADFAPEQMWGEGYYTTPREAGRDFGVYYHAGFWGCGPHLVQGNKPEKIYYNYKNAIDKGDTRYSILNVGNFREFVFNIKCVADLTWDFDNFNTDTFRLKWCEKEFKVDNPCEISEIYKEYYECFHEMDSTIIPGQMLLMDGMTRRVAFMLIEIIRGRAFRKLDIQNTRLFDFKSTNDFVTYYMNATREGIKRFKSLYNKAVATLQNIPEDRQQFFVANMIVHIEIILGLYKWVYNLCLAAVDRTTCKDDTKYKEHIDNAVFALAKICVDRRKAASDKWAHWYDGDALLNVAGNMELTRELYVENLAKTQDTYLAKLRY